MTVARPSSTRTFSFYATIFMACLVVTGCASYEQREVRARGDNPLSSTSPESNQAEVARPGQGSGKWPSKDFASSVRESLAIATIDKEGNFRFYSPDGQLMEPCTGREGRNPCAVFQRRVEVMNIEGAQLLHFKGSDNLVVGSGGKFWQICLDKPGGNPIPCPPPR